MTCQALIANVPCDRDAAYRLTLREQWAELHIKRQVYSCVEHEDAQDGVTIIAREELCQR